MPQQKIQWAQAIWHLDGVREPLEALIADTPAGECLDRLKDALKAAEQALDATTEAMELDDI